MNPTNPPCASRVSNSRALNIGQTAKAQSRPPSPCCEEFGCSRSTVQSLRPTLLPGFRRDAQLPCAMTSANFLADARQYFLQPIAPGYPGRPMVNDPPVSSERARPLRSHGFGCFTPSQGYRSPRGFSRSSAINRMTVVRRGNSEAKSFVNQVADGRCSPWVNATPACPNHCPAFCPLPSWWMERGPTTRPLQGNSNQINRLPPVKAYSVAPFIAGPPRVRDGFFPSFYFQLKHPPCNPRLPQGAATIISRQTGGVIPPGPVVLLSFFPTSHYAPPAHSGNRTPGISYLSSSHDMVPREKGWCF